MKQIKYDFSVIRKVVTQFNTYGILLSALVDWEKALADGRTGLTSKDMVPAILELVSAMDRPQMLDRFQGYARTVLSDEDFAELVVRPQVNYDFEQVVLQANPGNTALLDEIVMLRDLVLASELLTMPMSSEMSELLRLMTTLNRPRLSERLYRYYLLLIPVAGGS